MIKKYWDKIIGMMLLSSAIYCNENAKVAAEKFFSLPQNIHDSAFPTSKSSFITLQELGTIYWPKVVDHVLIQEREKNLLEKLYAHGQIVVTNKTELPFGYGADIVQPGEENHMIDTLNNIIDNNLELISGNNAIKIRISQGNFVLDENIAGAGQAMIYVQSEDILVPQYATCQGLVVGNIALLYNFIIQQLLVQLLNVNANINAKNRVLFWKPGIQEYPHWKIIITIQKDPANNNLPTAKVTGFNFGVDFINPLGEKELLSKKITLLPNENWNLVDDNAEKTPLFVKIAKTSQGKTEVTWARERKADDPKNVTISPITFTFNRPILSQNPKCPVNVAKQGSIP